ncbi:serine hydrolase domain-containing protein [Bradyrhizobium sp.]|uniref:serine hydrolase domain-containing protein n=1 Tax=Bradyrhizobium sp. TaxID=376 RepID=UPI003BAE651C
MNEPTFGRPQAATGRIPAGESIRARSAAMLGWRSVSPTEAGFADNMEERLDKAVAEKRIWNLHSVIVVRNGRLLLERYFDGEDDARGKPLGVVSFKPDTLHDLRSASKSIVGLVYGIALAAGKVPSPDQPLMQSFPEYADLFADADRRRWTLHHVLSMTMGTDWDELSIPYTDPANSEIAMDSAPDRYRYVLSRPIVMEPGKRWTYSGGATALLGRLIARGTGKSLHAFAREVLFDPLGMGPTDWFVGRDGELIAASGIRMLPRDLAKIGQLMLRGGVWEDRAVVPSEWIARCTTPVVPIDEVREYGYHWYLGRFGFEAPAAPRWNRSRLERYWNASGNGGQRLFVIPGLELLVVTTSGNYDTPDQWVPPTRVVREVVLPAIL